MSLPSCSVIITTCDRPEQLRRSVASVLAQTTPPSELIIIDDCSRDAPRDGEFSKPGYGAGCAVRVCRLEQRSGAPAARNAGASLARSEILMFLDDDDIWEHSKVETQLNLFAQHREVGTIYTGMLAVNEIDGGGVMHASRGHLSGRAWPRILFRNFMGPTSAVAMRAELYHQVGGFDPELSALQDYDLWIRLCMAAPVLYDGTHNLRFSAVSVSSERISQNVECYAAAFKYLRGKYRTQLEDLPLRQRRRFDAQAKLVEAGKYLQIRNYGSAAIRMAQAVALYPPSSVRLSRAAFLALWNLISARHPASSGSPYWHHWRANLALGRWWRRRRW